MAPTKTKRSTAGRKGGKARTAQRSSNTGGNTMQGPLSHLNKTQMRQLGGYFAKLQKTHQQQQESLQQIQQFVPDWFNTGSNTGTRRTGTRRTQAKTRGGNTQQSTEQRTGTGG